MSKKWTTILMLSVLLSGCFSWGRSDREQVRRLPDGAVQLQCAQNKSLIVRYTSDRKSAWIIYPDREFRLDRTSSADERYSNGPTTLGVDGNGAFLDSDGSRQFADCKSAAAQ